MVALQLRCNAANREVEGSIPDGIMYFSIDLLLPNALCPGCTQLLTEMSITHFLGGKGSRHIELTSILPLNASCL